MPLKRIFSFFVLMVTLLSCINVCFAYNKSEVDPTAFHMVNPLDQSGMTITGEFGVQRDTHVHAGIDLGGDPGDPVYAAASGTIYGVYPWQDGGGKGNCVVIDHGGGLFTTYMHLMEFAGFKKGDHVTQSNVIGAVGDTGDKGPGSYDPHLHFQICDGSPWGWNDGGEALNPHEWLTGLPPYTGAGYGQMSHNLQMAFDAKVDIAKPVKEFMDKFGEIASKAIKMLLPAVKKVILILFVIDFAIGACFRVIDPSGKESVGNNLFSWLLLKIFYYALMMFFVLHWSDFVGNLSKTLFTNFGAMAFGAEADAAQKAVSNPFDILQKGAETIAPLINQFFSANAIEFMRSWPILIASLIFGVILFFMFAVITMQIALTYIEFYIAVIFSFTTFVFAGVKQGKDIASRGLNAVFVSSLKLFFFSMFSLMLQSFMQDLQVDSFFNDENKAPAPIYGDTGSNGIITNLDDLMMHIMAGESEGNPYADNGSHYGYFQIADGHEGQPDNWNNWCHDYEDNILGNGGSLDMGPLDTEQAPDPPHTEPEPSYKPWTPRNQYIIAHMQMSLLYEDLKAKGWDDEKCFKGIAAAWSIGNPSEEAIAENEWYWNYILGKSADTSAFSFKTFALSFVVLIKLTAITFLFMLFGSRVGKTMEQTLGQGNGFKFTNEQ